MILKQKRIFIIEDNIANLAIATTYLRDQGAAINFERWGNNTADIILQSMPIDIILLDYMFPSGITGFDIAAQILANPRLQSIPILMISAAEPEDLIPAAREMGLAGFVSKPISAKIVSYVADVIAGKKVWIASADYTR
jgi:two-component system chemotaxis response regulator CheY